LPSREEKAVPSAGAAAGNVVGTATSVFAGKRSICGSRADE
jgi:hypothetical protein